MSDERAKQPVKAATKTVKLSTRAVRHDDERPDPEPDDKPADHESKSPKVRKRAIHRPLDCPDGEPPDADEVIARN